MEEIFKDVKGAEGIYQISTKGRLKSCERYIPYRNGGKALLKEIMMKSNVNYKGYEYFMLRINGKNKYKSVHHLVAEAFIPNPNGYTEINHKDENKLNNCVENLEWCSREYNMNYGTIKERVHNSLKNRADCSKAIHLYRNGEYIGLFPSLQEAHRQFGLSVPNLVGVLKGKHSYVGDGKGNKYTAEYVDE